MKRNLILFIHGLSGSNDSWKNKDEKLFGDLLKENELINESCDIAYYEYDTSFLFPKKLNAIINSVSLAFKKTDTKKEKDILTISREFSSVIEHKYLGYENIVLVSHSMGGLISKYSIIENNSFQGKIKLFYSIAVPHNGAELAYFVPTRFAHIQTKGLKPLSNSIKDINQKWLNHEVLPYTYYILGTNDIVVNEESSFGYEARKKNVDYKVVYESKGHTHISKPTKEDITFIVVETGIVDFLEKEGILNTLTSEMFKDIGQYDSMDFFIKLVISQITDSMKKSSKESFYKMDIIYRTLPPQEQKKLLELETKIKDLYREHFSNYETGAISNSSELLTQLKKEMRNEDNKCLKHSNDLFEHIHKFGLLHHMANLEESEIFWGKNQAYKDVLEYRSKL